MSALVGRITGGRVLRAIQVMVRSAHPSFLRLGFASLREADLFGTEEWRLGEERRLIIVNLSDHRSQALIPLPWEDLPGRPWHLTDPFTEQTYTRAGQDLHQPGLFVDLEAWQFHFFRVA